MAEEHLSIGEVLSLLHHEFPDVTISKIRFLESQRLISPERTPSGYRKFYAADIERLRWILVQQRENFLPLKVIRERLDSGDLDSSREGEESSPDKVQPEAQLDATKAAEPQDEAAIATEDPRPVTVRTSLPAGELESPVAVLLAAEQQRARDEAAQSAEPTRTQPIWMADLAASKGAKSMRAAESRSLDVAPGSPSGDMSLTASELVEAAGITFESLRELEQYGLIAGRPFSDDIYYDADALLIAKRSAGFLAHGIGARHLRMFKVSAEREAGFLEQVAMPMLKQRNPEARRQAVELVEELADLGHDLRAALLRANLRQHLHRS